MGGTFVCNFHLIKKLWGTFFCGCSFVTFLHKSLHNFLNDSKKRRCSLKGNFTFDSRIYIDYRIYFKNLNTSKIYVFPINIHFKTQCVPQKYKVSIISLKNRWIAWLDYNFGRKNMGENMGEIWVFKCLPPHLYFRNSKIQISHRCSHFQASPFFWKRSSPCCSTLNAKIIRTLKSLKH